MLMYQDRAASTKFEESNMCAWDAHHIAVHVSGTMSQ